MLPAIAMPFFRLMGQEKNIDVRSDGAAISARRISDKLIRGVINYPAGALRLNGFGDKLVILDFWASYCTPCLGLLPKYEAIQRELGAKVQFILVTREPATAAAACLKRLHITLPCVTQDRVLALVFPHSSIPHEVWIRGGHKLAATFGEEVNAREIQRVLEGGMGGKDINWWIKKS